MSEKITLDTAIYASVKELDVALLAGLPPAESLAEEYSSVNADKTHKSIKTEERKEIFYRLKNHLCRFAAAVAVAFTVSFSPFLTVSAVQDAVSETAVKWYNQYITVESNTPNAPREIKDLKVGYMTEGFVELERYAHKDKIVLVYWKDDAYITVSTELDNGNSIIGIDNEYTKFYDIEINGFKGIVAVHESGYNGLFICSDGIKYEITGYAGICEILEIYKNIKVFL